ncbi:MAG TPA: cytochrome C biogenesis protein ResB, partial [Clostridiales bacterium]|nr:cytochrome C biogenesis protein ResB [Clostridiales bacterium]
MEYLLTFLEGIISFISPCMLPMIPVYLLYFAGGKEESKLATVIKNTFGFFIGFSVVFVTLGLFAGTIGSFIASNSRIFDVISGIIIIFLALGFLGVFRLPLFGSHRFTKKEEPRFLSAVVFGMVFSVSLSPCVGAFLGTALLQAAKSGGALKGALMLISYSIGLGIPFILSAILINRLKSAFDYIKKHYKIINTVSGIFLILVGILMITGYMRVLTSLL